MATIPSRSPSASTQAAARLPEGLLDPADRGQAVATRLPDLREAAAQSSWAHRGRRATRGSQGRLGAVLPIERGFESAVMMPNLGHPIQLPLRIGISLQLIFPEA